MKVVTVGNAVLYLGDCRRQMLTWLGADALVFDPPYGIAYRVKARSPRGAMLGMKNTSTAAREIIFGDKKPFNPRPWLGAPKVAIFGADHFCDRLPPNTKWIVWDKRRDGTPDDHSDGELIWTNVKGALRFHRQIWRGIAREGEENCSNAPKQHPNQKPVALISRIFRELLLPPGSLVADPFMGSGSTGVAAIRQGHRFIGCEIDPEHFETARRRIEDEQRQGVLFGAAA